MAVTAEGVEREVQRSLLQRAGRNEVQGFLFSTAVSEGQLIRMLSHPSKRQACDYTEGMHLLRTG